MHFEVLTEDKSGSYIVETVLNQLLGSDTGLYSWRVHSYRGLGRIPKNLSAVTDPSRRILLDQLPRLLRGYGRSLDNNRNAVVVVVDVDNRDCIAFKNELTEVVKACDPAPVTLFRIAIEETEAWLLGDRQAVLDAYPRAKPGILDAYPQDGIVGTWEVLANALYSGGAKRLHKLGYPEIGIAKCEWAQRIASHMKIERNRSHSFQVFLDGIRQLAGL